MTFTNLLFPFAFLPVSLLLYYLLPRACRNGALLVCSLLFFAWGTPEYLVFLLLSISLNYLAGLEISAHLEAGKPARAKAAFVLTVILDLIPLALFKYYGAFASWLNAIASLHLPVRDLPAPVGVSFYTFTLISSLSDLYHGRAPMERNPVRFANFVTFFPKLVSGPIARYETMHQQLEPHPLVWLNLADGTRRFILGLAKKVLLANLLGVPFYALQSRGAGNLSTLGAWLGCVCYSLMLYFDFSGYSDMAVGVARMFGFELPENFDYPYTSGSLSEFWRRWHASLGMWFRTYVYIPLGGSRAGKGSTIRNLLIVWLLTGLWHGANGTFLLWGVFHGVLLILEKFALAPVLDKTPKLFRHVLTVLLVMIGWVPFFCPNLREAFLWLRTMFSPGGAGLADGAARYCLHGWPVLVISALACLPYGARIGNRFLRGSRTLALVSAVWLIVLLLLCIAGMMNSTYSSFLYFQF